MKRAVVSLPLPGEVLTTISTLRVGCQAVAAKAARGDDVIARSAATCDRGARSPFARGCFVTRSSQ